MKNFKYILFLTYLPFLLIACSKSDNYDGRISGEWKLKSTTAAPFPANNIITIKFDENNLELFQDGALIMKGDLDYIDTKGALLVFKIDRKYVNEDIEYNLGFSESMLAYKFSDISEIYLEDQCCWPEKPIGFNCYRYNFIKN